MSNSTKGLCAAAFAILVMLGIVVLFPPRGDRATVSTPVASLSPVSPASAAAPMRTLEIDKLFLDLLACQESHCQFNGPAGPSAVDLDADRASFQYAMDGGHSGCAALSHARQVITGYVIIEACRVEIAIKNPLDTYRENEPLHIGTYRFLGLGDFQQKNGFATKLPVIELVQR